METAFLTEMGFEGKVPSTHPNMRTEFAWMSALEATHFNIRSISRVKDFDAVFIILPKGKVFLSAEGTNLSNQTNPTTDILEFPYAQTLKNQGNKKVFYIQEGPTWWFNDYEIKDQINFYNQLSSYDGILAHNEYDVNFYKGIFPDKKVQAIGTLMIETLVDKLVPTKAEKTIIGGNFARWYGGFQSYMVAQEFQTPIYVQDSHCKRAGESQLPNLTHLPRMSWNEWMNNLSTYKYAIHLMPTIAAGTFSLNCAYFGIPCIGNEKVDTQRLCHPSLMVDVEDVAKARKLAQQLKQDKDFYNHCSLESQENYRKLYTINKWKENLINFING
jgi:hypothetical protein